MAKDSAKSSKKKKKKGKHKAESISALAAGELALAAESLPTSESPAKSRKSKVAEAVSQAKAAAHWVAENPMTAEIVAAALVAAAAAIRDPAKARRMATEAADDLESAAAGTAEKTSDMWHLALDIARRSLEALSGPESPPANSTPDRRSLQ